MTPEQLVRHLTASGEIKDRLRLKIADAVQEAITELFLDADELTSLTTSERNLGKSLICLDIHNLSTRTASEAVKDFAENYEASRDKG